MTITDMIERGETFAPDVMPFGAGSLPAPNGVGAGSVLDVLDGPIEPRVIQTTTYVDDPGQTPQILPEIVVTAERSGVPRWVWLAGAAAVTWWLFSRRG